MDLSYLENKRIVDEGVKYLSEHAFLMGLIKEAHYNVQEPIPSIKDIGWVIGPNINSIIRLGTQPQKNIIFLALTTPNLLVFSSKKGHEDEQVPIYDEAIRLCDNAKKRQTTAINKSIKIIEHNVVPDDHNSIIYIDEDQELTFELSGLIANKLLSVTNKPVILLKHYTDNKGIDEYRGSVRGKAVEGLTNLKNVIKDVTGVTMAEGHAFAFGLNVEKEAFPTFKTHLNSILDKIDFNTNLYIVDLVADYHQLNTDIGRIMAADNVWCHGVDKPQAILQNIPTDNYEVMGANGQHIKINCGQFDVVMFNVPNLVRLLEAGEKYNLNVVGEFDIDKSYNVGRLQFMVKDYEQKEHTQLTIWDYAF